MRDLRFVVCAAAFSVLLSSAMGGDHWSGREISQKFEEHDRAVEKIPALVTASSSARRRITDLEAEVRLLRRQVVELESALRRATESIGDLQIDIAKVAAGRDATKTVRTPAPAASTPGVAPEATVGQASVAGSRVRNEGDFSVITGSVENTTDAPLTFVVVRADFLDNRGNVVKSESVYTSPRIIGPRGKATFKINTRRDHRVRKHRLTVETR